MYWGEADGHHHPRDEAVQCTLRDGDHVCRRRHGGGRHFRKLELTAEHTENAENTGRKDPEWPSFRPITGSAIELELRQRDIPWRLFRRNEMRQQWQRSPRFPGPGLQAAAFCSKSERLTRSSLRRIFPNSIS